MEKKDSKFNDDYYYELARKNIRRYRKFREITQEQLAEKIDVSKDFIAQIESPKIRKHCTLGTLGRIAEALDILIIDLLKEDD